MRRVNYSSKIDHVWTANASTVVNVRASWQRYINYSAQEKADSFDGSQLGWKVPIGSSPEHPLSAVELLRVSHYGDRRLQREPYFLARPVLHADCRRFQNRRPPPAQDGHADRRDTAEPLHLRLDLRQLRFTAGFTQRNPQTSDSTSGNSIASFLLGDVASGNTDINAQSSAVFRTYGLYIQDNFTVTSKLTLNLGLRWDLQTPITERWDRMVTGFDPTATYALGSGTASGGLTFAKAGARSTWSAKKTGFQPRFGMAYQINRRLVMRASYGMSYLPLGGTGGLVTVRQNGYSRSTPYVSTSGGGANSYIPNLPGNSTWDNPFPAGVLQPYGNTLGARTFVGQGITYRRPELRNPARAPVQRGLRIRGAGIEDHAGGFLRRQPDPQAHATPRTSNAISMDDSGSSCVSNTSLCTNSVANPFAGAR